MVAFTQPVTGVWRGKVTRGNGVGKQTYKLEVKLVKKGDSLTGTSYYYASATNYFRYSIKGFFGRTDNSVNWWDDELIESHSPNIKLGNANNLPMFSETDFNCPGAGIMKLDGSSHPKNGGYAYEIHLDKYQHPDFRDEWDPIIEDYFYGGADPKLIDSVSKIAFARPPLPPPVIVTTPAPAPQKEITVNQPPKEVKSAPEVTQPEIIKEATPAIVTTPPVKAVALPPAGPLIDSLPTLPVVVVMPPVKRMIDSQPPPLVMAVVPPPTVEEKFAKRKNVLTHVIPVTGDSIEFKFYDNAEVDGDSISIFLNKKLLYTHVRLTDKGYSIKIPVKDLGADNELVMVAENLGSIPPNTAYMEAWSGGKRYAARMESTELSSAMIKLKRDPHP